MAKTTIRYLALILVTAPLLATGLPALGAPPENFTATMVTMGMEMPMARMGTKLRVENPVMKGVVTITLGDAKKTIMMNTASKTYFEQAVQDQEKGPDVYDPDMVFEKKRVGTESIDNHPCIRYEATFYRKGKPAEKHKATIWEAQDLKEFVIQTEITVPPEQRTPSYTGRIVTKFKDIKLGAASPSMFEVPRDYKKAGSMPDVMISGGTGGGMMDMGEMMKNMPKGQRPPKP